jgi:hypothetical protein
MYGNSTGSTNQPPLFIPSKILGAAPLCDLPRRKLSRNLPVAAVLVGLEPQGAPATVQTGADTRRSCASGSEARAHAQQASKEAAARVPRWGWATD